jgi:membrane protein DedA with SNARE-associated domain
MTGFSGQGVIENRQWYDRVTVWMKKYGGITILVLAFIPNPLFDIAGMVAGALRMPLWKYLVFSWIGKVGKMLLFALGGAQIFALIA